MAVQLIVSCPFCGKDEVGAQLQGAWKAGVDVLGTKPRGAKGEGVAVCGACNSLMIVYFDVAGGADDIEIIKTFAENTNDLVSFIDAYLETGITIRGVRPTPPRPDVPAHLPRNVERAMHDAEKAFLRQDWNGAAAHYRKAVDRAVSIILHQIDEGGELTGKMLGTKLGMLERSGLLPDPMLDWIRIVKDQGNFALHEDDRDFDRAEDIEPARRFARLLLEYLFTLPEEVRLARERFAEG